MNKEKLNYEKKDYTFGEIILGLRDEYLLYQQKLRELKQFCEMDSRKATDFHFRISKFDKNNPILLCDYLPKQNSLEKIVTDLSKKMGYYIYGRNTVHLVTDNNQYYFLSGMKKYPIHIKYDMDIKFNDSAKKILMSEFVNNILSQYIEDNCSDLNAVLTIKPAGIELFIRDNQSHLPKSVIFYNSQDDNLEFKSFSKQLQKTHLEMALSVSIPYQKLNNYHIQKIHSNPNTSKPIILEEFNLYSELKFNFEPNETQCILRKVAK